MNLIRESFISKLSLYAHSVNPLCLLQRLILFISGRKVVCLNGIKVIIFHACARGATGSYTFTAYYLPKVSWLRNTLFPKLKVRKVPGVISGAAFSGIRGYLVFPSCRSDSLNLRARLGLIPSRAAGNLRWGPQGAWRGFEEGEGSLWYVWFKLPHTDGVEHKYLNYS